MKVYFVRHGQTDWNVQSRIQGQSDIPLNQRGIAQAKALAAQLKTLAIDCIITSPLQRTKQTAALLNETLQVPILEEEGLKERDFGEFEGVLKLRWKEAQKQEEAILRTCSELEQKIFRYHRYGYRYDEIAAILHTTKKKVDNTIQKIRKKL